VRMRINSINFFPCIKSIKKKLKLFRQLYGCKMSCEKCIYIDNGIKTYFECCCEFDKIQILADDARATKDGFVYVNGRWIKHCAKKYIKKPPQKVKFIYID